MCNTLGGIELLDMSMLRKNIRGIKGAFLTRDGDMLDVDMELDRDIERISRIIFYLSDIVCEKKGTIKKFSIASDDRFFLFFHNSYVLGVIVSPDTDLFLLDVVASRILELVEDLQKTRETPEKQELPKTLAREVPHFNQPKEKVLLNAPAYACQVLKFVNGTRTVKEIIEQSKLPPEVVLDVILAYSKRSVLVF